MAVAHDASMTGGNATGGTNQQVSSGTTISSTGMTVGGSATLLVMTIVWGNGAGVVTSPTATWNSVSMTLAKLETNGATVAAAIFYLISPTTGNKTLACSWTNPNDAYMGCDSFTGTDTSTGIVTADTVFNTQATSLTVTSASSDATVAVFGGNSAAPTMNFNTSWTNAALNPCGGANYQLGGSSNAHTATGSGATTEAMVGVHVKSAGGGGGRGLFRQTPMNGLGIGGSFFSNPIGYTRHPMISLYIPERLAA